EDHALGTSLASQAQMHLAACPLCASVLDRLREQASAIDRGLALIVTAEPSPSLRTRISVALRSTEGRSSLATPLRIAIALAGVVAIFAAATALQLSRTTERTQHPTSTALAAAAALSHWRSPTNVLLAPKFVTHTKT